MPKTNKLLYNQACLFHTNLSGVQPALVTNNLTNCKVRDLSSFFSQNPSLQLDTMDFGLGVISTIGNEMLDACSAGNLPKLEKLLDGTELSRGLGVEVRCYILESEQPTIYELLLTAIKSRRTTVVTFLLERYPDFPLSQLTELFHAILDNADTDTLRACLVHQPRWATSSVDYGMRCFITDACARPPDRIVPILHLLIDYGADLNDGWGPGGGALYAALIGSQPGEIIEKMVQKGGDVSPTIIHTAIKKERLDVLPSLLRDRQVQLITSADLMEWTKDTENEKVISLVESFITKREAEKAKRAKRAERWWQVWKFGR